MAWGRSGYYFDDCDNGWVVNRIKEFYPILYGKIDFCNSKLIGKEFATGIVLKMVKGKEVSWVGFGHETNTNQRSKWLSWMENCIEKKAILLSKTIVEVKIEKGVKDLTKGRWNKSLSLMLVVGRLEKSTFVLTLFWKEQIGMGELMNIVGLESSRAKMVKLKKKSSTVNSL